MTGGQKVDNPKKISSAQLRSFLRRLFLITMRTAFMFLT